MIDLAALKQQLLLLGHNLPDEQVLSILKDMNIDFEDMGEGPPGQQADIKPAQPRNGSILDSFQERPPQPGSDNLPASAATSEPAERFHYAYTDHLEGAALGISTGGTRNRPQTNQSRSAVRTADAAEYSDNDEDGAYDDDPCEQDDDADDVEEPGLSCRHCVAEGQHRVHAGACGASAVTSNRQAWMDPAASFGRGTGTGSNRGAYSGSGICGPMQPNRPNGHSSELADSIGRLNLLAPGAAVTGSLPRTGPSAAATRAGGGGAAAAAPRPSSAMPPRASSTSRVRDQLPKGASGHPDVPPYSRYSKTSLLRQEASDVSLAVDKDPLGLGSELHDLAWMKHSRAPAVAYGAPRPAPHTSAGGGAARRDGPAARPGLAAASGHGAPGAGGGAVRDPYDREWLYGARLPNGLDAGNPGRSLSPQPSDRSFASRTSTASRGSRGGGARKVDRVQRYQQLAQEWGSNTFLRQAGGANRGTSRKPVNFHSHFAGLHAAEEADRQRMLRDTRAKTKKELGSATEAPTANRRDELRWQTRQRLREQS